MARITEVGPVLRSVGAWKFLKRVVGEIISDDVFTIAAAVAFYWLFAFFPLLIFLLSLLPLLPQELRDAARQQIAQQVNSYVTARSSAELIMQNVDSLLSHPRAALLSVGALLALWGASNGVDKTMAAIDQCYDIVRRRPFFKQRGLALLLTLGVTVSVVAVLLLIPVSDLILNLIAHFVPAHKSPPWLSGPVRILIDIGRYTLGLALLVFIVSAIYQWGVTVRRRWAIFSPGAIVAVLAVIVTGWGFGWYINAMGQNSYDKTYGAVGAVAILLLLFYLYACAFLIGAEINSEIDFAVVGLHDCQPGDLDPGDAACILRTRSNRKEDLINYRRQLQKRRAVVLSTGTPGEVIVTTPAPAPQANASPKLINAQATSVGESIAKD